MSTREHDIAIREAHSNAAEEGFFDAHPTHDNTFTRMYFGEGFKRGYHARDAHVAAVEKANRAMAERIVEMERELRIKRAAEPPQPVSVTLTVDTGPARASIAALAADLRKAVDAIAAVGGAA